MTTLQLKREFLKNCKDIVSCDPEWLLKSYNTPNGYETTWSKKIKRAVLKRNKLIK